MVHRVRSSHARVRGEPEAPRGRDGDHQRNHPLPRQPSAARPVGRADDRSSRTAGVLSSRFGRAWRPSLTPPADPAEDSARGAGGSSQAHGGLSATVSEVNPGDLGVESKECGPYLSPQPSKQDKATKWPEEPGDLNPREPDQSGRRSAVRRRRTRATRPGRGSPDPTGQDSTVRGPKHKRSKPATRPTPS